MEMDGQNRSFEVRALELHSQYAWDYNWIIKTMDFMKNLDFNTLVLHRNDFIDLIIYPGENTSGTREMLGTQSLRPTATYSASSTDIPPPDVPAPTSAGHS